MLISKITISMTLLSSVRWLAFIMTILELLFITLHVICFIITLTKFMLTSIFTKKSFVTSSFTMATVRSIFTTIILLISMFDIKITEVIKVFIIWSGKMRMYLAPRIINLFVVAMMLFLTMSMRWISSSMLLTSIRLLLDRLSMSILRSFSSFSCFELVTMTANINIIKTFIIGRTSLSKNLSVSSWTIFVSATCFKLT